MRMKPRSAVETVTAVGTELFAVKGYSSITVLELVNKSGVPESTLRRHFPEGTVSVYESVVKNAAKHVFDAYLKTLHHAQLDTLCSDPRLLVRAYIETVLSLWTADGISKQYVTMLFGNDGRSSWMSRTLKITDRGATFLDLDLLGQVILRGSAGNATKAHGLECLVIGTLTEFIRSCGTGDKRPEEVSDDVRQVIELVDELLTRISVKDTVSEEVLERAGVPMSVLRHIADETRKFTAAIDGLLSAQTQ